MPKKTEKKVNLELILKGMNPNVAALHKEFMSSSNFASVEIMLKIQSDTGYDLFEGPDKVFESYKEAHEVFDKAIQGDRKALIKFLQGYPDALYRVEVIDQIRILQETVRHSQGEERRKARDILEECLIPKKQGGPKLPRSRPISIHVNFNRYSDVAIKKTGYPVSLYIFQQIKKEYSSQKRKLKDDPRAWCKALQKVKEIFPELNHPTRLPIELEDLENRPPRELAIGYLSRLTGSSEKTITRTIKQA